MATQSQNKNISAKDLSINDICSVSGLDRSAYEGLSWRQVCEIYEKVVMPVIELRKKLNREILIFTIKKLEHETKPCE